MSLKEFKKIDIRTYNQRYDARWFARQAVRQTVAQEASRKFMHGLGLPSIYDPPEEREK
jgi:hypothetical protein